MLSVKYIPMQYYDAIIIRFTGEDGGVHNIFVVIKSHEQFAIPTNLRRNLRPYSAWGNP